MLQTVILARVISKEDFGLMAITLSALAVLAIISEFGLGRAIIHFDDSPPEVLSTLYWVNLSLAILLMLGVCAAAPLIGDLYGSRDLMIAMQLGSLNFPLMAAGQQLRTRAEKALQFATLGKIDVLANVLGLCVALLFAFTVGGFYALVASLLTRSAANSALSWRWLPNWYRPSFQLSLSSSKKHLKFGAYLVGESLVNTVHRDIDVFIGGALLGPTLIGIYSLPRELCFKISAVVINPVLTRVSTPVFARIKHDMKRLSASYLKLIRMSSSINAPLYSFLAVFADDVVLMLYGHEWLAAGVYLRIFSVWGLARSIANPIGSLLHATGQARRAFLWNLAQMFLLPPVYWFSAHRFGLVGLASSLAIIQLVVIVPLWRFLVFPCCRSPFSSFARQFTTPTAISLVTGFSAWLATEGIEISLVRLLFGGAVGGLVYLGLSWALNRQWLDVFIELLAPRTKHPFVLDADSERQ